MNVLGLFVEPEIVEPNKSKYSRLCVVTRIVIQMIFNHSSATILLAVTSNETHFFAFVTH